MTFAAFVGSGAHRFLTAGKSLLTSPPSDPLSANALSKLTNSVNRAIADFQAEHQMSSR